MVRGFICRDCRNHFMQEPKCTSCGAEKLYDSTVRGQAVALETLSARVQTLEEAVHDALAHLVGAVSLLRKGAGTHGTNDVLETALNDFEKCISRTSLVYEGAARDHKTLI